MRIINNYNLYKLKVEKVAVFFFNFLFTEDKHNLKFVICNHIKFHERISHGLLYNWTGINQKTKFLTEKLNFKSTVPVQRASFLPIPIDYTIRTEILSSFQSTYLKRSEIFENFRKSPFFTHTFFSQHIKSLILGAITMP